MNQMPAKVVKSRYRGPSPIATIFLQQMDSITDVPKRLLEHTCRTEQHIASILDFVARRDFFNHHIPVRVSV